MATAMQLRTVTVNGRTFIVDAEHRQAANLSPGDTLADGTIVSRASHQSSGWTYVRGLRPNGQIVRRRYRHRQWVAVEAAWRDE